MSSSTLTEPRGTAIIQQVKPNAIVLLDEEHWQNVYGMADIRSGMERLVQLSPQWYSRHTIGNAGDKLASAEILFSGWGMPKCDESFLRRAPNLKAIFVAAGSVRDLVTEALWERNIVVSSANPALGACVAEFTLGQILLSLKALWHQATNVRRCRTALRTPFPGIYGSTIGLISVGTIARQVIALLQPFHVHIIAYDPFLSESEAQALGIELCSLEDVLSRADVVSLHTPWLPETERMIRGHHLEMMKPGATFINTSRGAIVDQEELIEVFSRRNDLFALLDVTYPDPPPASSAIYDLPNVIITPHIAGALGSELSRLGRMAVDECQRYLRKEPLHGAVTRQMIGKIA